MGTNTTNIKAAATNKTRRANWPRIFGYDFFISFKLGTPPIGAQSYASDLARRLHELDFVVFFSEEEAPPGENLNTTLVKALHRSRILVVVVNEGALKSPWVRDEVKEFRRKHPKRRVILINVDGAIEKIEKLEPQAEALRWLDPVAAGRIWLDETMQALNEGITSSEVLERLQIAPRFMKANARLRWVLGSIILGLVGLTLLLYQQWQLAEKSTLSALIDSSEAHYRAGEDWDALMASLKAAKKFRSFPLSLLEKIDPRSDDLRTQISQSVQQAVYRIREYQRLADKDSGNIFPASALGQIAWSPDGKSLAFVRGQRQNNGREPVIVMRPDSNSLAPIHLENPDAQRNDLIQSVSWRPPDGKTLAISSRKGIISCFDPQGKQCQAFRYDVKKSDQNFYGISWRPDGHVMALASFSEGLMLMKPDDPRLDHPLPQMKGQVWGVSWSPDPQHMLAATDFHGVVSLLNPENPSSACKVDIRSHIQSMSWHPDGNALAVVGQHLKPDNSVKFLSRDCNKEQPEQKSLLTGHTELVDGISWSKNGVLATASQDRTVRLWNKEGTLLATFQCPTVRGGVQWRPDGQVLATLDQHGLVRLWKDNPLLKLFTFTDHAAINDAALSPDGQILASASKNGISLWRQDQEHPWLSEPTFLPSDDKPVNSVSWSPNGQLLASTTHSTVTLWLRDGTWRRTLRDDEVGNKVHTVSWNHNGQTIATGDGKGNITLWDSNNGFILGRSSCSDWVQSVAWNPVDERLLAAGCHDQGGAYVLAWKPDKKEIVRTKLIKEGGIGTGHSGIQGVQWSPNGQMLATSGLNHIQLWGRDGKHILEIDNKEETGRVAWSPDGQMLAVASGNVVKLWRHDGHLVTVLKGHTRAVTSVTWNAKLKTLVSASADGTVKMWLLDKALANHPLETLVGHSCGWLKGYLTGNPLVSKDEKNLQDFCKNVDRR